MSWPFYFQGCSLEVEPFALLPPWGTTASATATTRLCRRCPAWVHRTRQTRVTGVQPCSRLTRVTIIRLCPRPLQQDSARADAPRTTRIKEAQMSETSSPSHRQCLQTCRNVRANVRIIRAAVLSWIVATEVVMTITVAVATVRRVAMEMVRRVAMEVARAVGAERRRRTGTLTVACSIHAPTWVKRWIRKHWVVLTWLTKRQMRPRLREATWSTRSNCAMRSTTCSSATCSCDVVTKVLNTKCALQSSRCCITLCYVQCVTS